MAKRKLIIIGILILMGILAVFVLRFFVGGDEDTWLCVNGEWIKHGNPSAAKPTEGCGETQKESDVVVISPQPNEVITSPVTVEGKAKGNWFFEAVAPVRLLNDKGQELASTHIDALSDWMTTDYVPFKAELKFSVSATTSGVLVFNNDNPSGLPEKSKEFRVPVIISPSAGTTKINIYFNNSKMDPEFSCNKVFPVVREIIKTQAVARAALEELLKGPTDSEKSEEFFTNINPGVKIQKLTIENGVAKVDFDEQLEFQVGGSCRVAAISQQIIQTLKQFPTIKEVIISINGRTEDILQP